MKLNRKLCATRREFLDALAPRIYFHFYFLFYFRNFSHLQFISSSLKGGMGRVFYRFFPLNVTSGMSISSMLMPPCWKVSL